MNPQRPTSLDVKKMYIMYALYPQAHFHRFGIQQEIKAKTDEYMPFAVIYVVLNKLRAEGLITQESGEIEEGDNPPRRLYALTDAGRNAFADMAARLKAEMVREETALRSNSLIERVKTRSWKYFTGETVAFDVIMGAYMLYLWWSAATKMQTGAWGAANFVLLSVIYVLTFVIARSFLKNTKQVKALRQIAELQLT